MIFGKVKASNMSKAFTWLALLAVVVGTQTLQPVSSALANTATISDPDGYCQITVTSQTVTIDSTSTSIALVGSRCVVQFLTVGSYSIAMPNDALVDYLVVGGGGGGGSGGGGAGGVLQGTNYQVTSEDTYSISVGAGGNGGSSQGHLGRNSTAGGSSVFDSLTALGGGTGGQSNQRAGNGGSGGGARYDCTNPASCAGIGTPGQGTNGAASTYPSYGGGAGGGGAGGAGANTVLSNIGGKGGDGVISSITGTPTYYGGGGGGGINSNNNAYCGLNPPGTSNSNYYCLQTPVTTGGGVGGLGGGGRGSSWGFTGGTRGEKANGTAGTPNTGGGGGGVDPEDSFAYDGGSGIVVLSYVSSASFRKITFNSNNGSGTTSTQSVESEVETELQANPFTYTDYVFQGWNTKADGTGTSYSNSQSITTTSSFTLYAQWLAGVNKTVTFDPNGGSGTQDAQVAGLPTTLNANQFTKSGYTFTRWTTAANGSGYSYADKATFSFAQSTTLYAQWTVSAVSRSVSFYGNGATSGTTSSQIANSTQPLNVNGFSRTGYNFLGWNTSNSANTAQYLDLQNYSFNADLSLYAIWVLEAPNTITFNGNNSSSGSMANQVASSRTLLGSNTFERTGYTFLNWNTAANGTGVSYSSSYVYNFAQSTTLYAIWGQDFTVSYSGNTETSGTAPESQSSYAGGPALALANNTGGLAKAGFVLSGWNTAADGSGTSYALGQSKVTLASGVTLYAQWLGASYVIIYSANNSSSGAAPASQSYTYGSAGITLSNNTGTLVRTGYTFDGWNTEADGSGTSYEPGATDATFAQDTVLFAKWNPMQTTVTYSYNGADGANTTETQTYSFGAEGLTLPTPTRSGFNFLGWSTYYGDEVSSPYSPGLIEEITLYALWAKKILTVDYIYNLGDSTGLPISVSYEWGDDALILPEPTRAKFHFDGWFDALSGGNLVGLGAADFVPTNNVSIFAQWTQNTLYGIDDVTNIGNGVISGDANGQVTGAGEERNVLVNIPGGALPDETEINIYSPGNSSKAESLIPGPVGVLVDVVVSWLGADGKVPSTPAGTPAVVTITDPSIKAGAALYKIVDGVATFIGRATQDGSAEITITDAAQIVIAATAPAAPLNASATAATGSATVRWSAPLMSGGSAIISYLVTASTGQTCRTETLTCTVTGLINGVNVSFTVQAINSVGTGIAGAPTATVKPFDPNGDGNLAAKLIPSGGLKKFVATNDKTMLVAWDKSSGKLIPQTTGIYTGYIQAKIVFTKAGKTYNCSAVFGDVKIMPQKTAAQKAVAMKMKNFTGNFFCIDKTKLDPKTIAPKGGFTSSNFKKIKPINKSAAELLQEKSALAALKGFTGLAEIQVIRYRAWPTTMLNVGEHNGKGGKIPELVRNTVVRLG